MAASETLSNSHLILTIHFCCVFFHPLSSASLITPKVLWGSEDSPLHQQSPHPTTSTAPSFSNAVMTLVGYFIEFRRDSSNSSLDWTFVHRLPGPSPKLGASWIISSTFHVNRAPFPNGKQRGNRIILGGFTMIVARVIEVQGCFTPFSFNFKGSTGFMLQFFSWGCLKQDQKNRPQESKGRVCSTSSLTIGSLGDILVVACEKTTSLPKLVKLSWNKTVKQLSTSFRLPCFKGVVAAMATECSHHLTQVRCLHPEKVGEVCIYPKWVHNI